jgi:triphosphatase
MRREIELTFGLNSPSKQRVLGWLAERGAENYSDAQKLRAIYFETPDFDLRCAGISLGIRASAGRYLQTIKADCGSTSEILDRHKWERTVKGFEPDLARTHRHGLTLFHSKALIRAIRPLFHVTMRQETYVLARGHATFGITIETGVVTTSGSAARFFDLVITLREGTSEALFRFVRSLSKSLALRLSARTKLERGYELIESLVKNEKSIEPVISPKSTAEDAFRAIARRCLWNISLNEAETIAGEQEALHQMRVGLRRLSASISAFPEMLAGLDAKRLKKEFKWAMKYLGEARDLDVFVDDILKHRSSGSGEKAFRLIERRLRTLQRSRHRKVKQMLMASRYRLLVTNTLIWIECGTWRQSRRKATYRNRRHPVVKHAARMLARRHRRFISKLSDLKELRPSELHRLRINAKKLRYSVEFFGSAFPGKKAKSRRGKLLSALKRLQDTLGALNDISVHEKMMRDLAFSDRQVPPVKGSQTFSAGIVFGIEEKRRGILLDAADKSARKIAAIHPFWN